MFVLSLITTFFASQVFVHASPSPYSHGTLSNILSARQSQSPPTIPASAIPSQCQSACKAMLDVGNSCATAASIDCLCSDATGNAFVQCGNCIVNLPGVTDDLKSLEQSGLDALTSTCQTEGHPFSKPLKVSASSKGGALSVSPSSAFAFLSVLGGLFALAV